MFTKKIENRTEECGYKMSRTALYIILHGVALNWTKYYINRSTTEQILNNHKTNGTVKIKKVLPLVLNI